MIHPHANCFRPDDDRAHPARLRVAMPRPILVGCGLVAIAGVALFGCALARRTPQVRYYTLALSGEPPARLSGPVRVGAFTADQPYATERLAYRTSPYRLDYYSYHRWAADPRLLVAAAVRDYLERAAPPADENPARDDVERSGRQDVERPARDDLERAGRHSVERSARNDPKRTVLEGAGASLELEGHIRRIEEVDDTGGWQGALALDLKLDRGGKVLLERSYAEIEPAEARNPEAVAAALSRGLKRILDRFVAELESVDAGAVATSDSGTPAPARQRAAPNGR